MAETDNAAEESTQVKRARAKLTKILTKEQEHFTRQELDKASRIIRAWIDRHAEDRVDLKEKSFQLFDQNAHPAKTTSRYVKALRNQLKEGTPPQEEIEVAPVSSLRGRVTLADFSVTEPKTDLANQETDDPDQNA